MTRKPSKLGLNRETLRTIGQAALSQAGGAGFILIPPPITPTALRCIVLVSSPSCGGTACTQSYVC